MSTWKKMDLCIERTDFIDLTSIWTDLVDSDKAADLIADNLL